MISAFGVEHGDISKGFGSLFSRAGKAKGVSSVPKVKGAGPQGPVANDPWATPKKLSGPSGPTGPKGPGLSASQQRIVDQATPWKQPAPPKAPAKSFKSKMSEQARQSNMGAKGNRYYDKTNQLAPWNK